MKLEKQKRERIINMILLLFLIIVVILIFVWVLFGFNINKNHIRLVVFDMGDTLWTEVKDQRAIVITTNRNNNNPFYYMIDRDQMFFREGISLKLFKGIKKLFSKLYKRHFNVSICSINEPGAWKWMEKNLFDLNVNGFIKYSRIGHQNGDKEIKGKWILEIIHDWNVNEYLRNPIRCNEVLFVDDKIKNHLAVQKYCPGIHVIFPQDISKLKRGMLAILDIINSINK